MRKHNIGRISVLVIFLNAIFLLVYLADKNGVGLQSETTQQVVEEEVQTELIIYMDETVGGEYVTMLENIISDQKQSFSEEDLSIIRSYEWYLTDNINIASAERYFIKDGEIVIFAADDDFVTYINAALKIILK